MRTTSNRGMPLIPLWGVGDMLRSSLRRRSPLKVMQTVRHIRATRRIARNPPANMDTASSAMALGTICRRKLRKSSVRRSLMLIAFDRDRSDRYPGAVYSHLIGFARCAGWLRTNVCRSVVEFLNRWLSGEINTVGRIKNDEALFRIRNSQPQHRHSHRSPKRAPYERFTTLSRTSFMRWLLGGI